jgi:hypothetical protein
VPRNPGGFIAGRAGDDPFTHDPDRRTSSIRLHQRGRDADPEVADGSRAMSARGFEDSISLDR